MAKQTKIKIRNVITGRNYEVTERGWETILKNPEVSSNYIVREPIRPVEADEEIQKA